MTDEAEPGETDSVGEAIVQAADDARAYAAAQIALYKAIAGARWRLARTGLILVAVAATLAFAAIIALLIGLIISLIPVLGPLGATASIVFAGVLIAGVLGWAASRRFAAAFGAID